MFVPDDGQDALVPVRAVGVHPHGLPADELIEVVSGLFALGLAGLPPVEDLGGVDVKEADAEGGAALKEGGYDLAVGATPASSV